MCHLQHSAAMSTTLETNAQMAWHFLSNSERQSSRAQNGMVSPGTEEGPGSERAPMRLSYACCLTLAQIENAVIRLPRENVPAHD